VLLVGALVFGLIPGERNKVRVVVAVVGLSGMGLVVVGIVAPRVILKLVESRIAGQFGAEDMGLVGLWLSVVRVAVAELAYTVMGLGLVAILGAGLGWRMLVSNKFEGYYKWLCRGVVGVTILAIVAIGWSVAAAKKAGYLRMGNESSSGSGEISG